MDRRQEGGAGILSDMPWHHTLHGESGGARDSGRPGRGFCCRFLSAQTCQGRRIPALISYLPESLGQAPLFLSPRLKIKGFSPLAVRFLLAQGFCYCKWISYHSSRREETCTVGPVSVLTSAPLHWLFSTRSQTGPNELQLDPP